MKRRVLTAAALVGAASVVAMAGTGRLARSADHLDSPATQADHTVDINDLYGWMDGSNMAIALTVFPNAMGATDAGAGSKFSDKVQYVIHTSSGAGFPATTTNEDVICTFTPAQIISCWLGTDEYVTGDASGAAGLASADGKFKVFAGLRSDPFFFNLEGFKHAVQTVEGAAAGLTFDVAGCPQLDGPTAAALRSQLQTSADGGPPSDFFASFNGLAIVVSVNKQLVTKGGAVVSLWASTHKAM